jgi:hypothetical protein
MNNLSSSALNDEKKMTTITIMHSERKSGRIATNLQYGVAKGGANQALQMELHDTVYEEEERKVGTLG